MGGHKSLKGVAGGDHKRFLALDMKPLRTVIKTKGHAKLKGVFIKHRPLPPKP